MVSWVLQVRDSLEVLTIEASSRSSSPLRTKRASHYIASMTLHSMSVKVEDLLKIILRQSELLREEVIQALFKRLRDGNLVVNKNDTLTIEDVSAIQAHKTQLLQWLHPEDALPMIDTIMLCRKIIDTLKQECEKHNTWNLYRDYEQQILHDWQNHGMTTNPFLVSLHAYS